MSDQSLVDISRQAQALVDIMHLIMERPDYHGVWTTAHMHGMVYCGPTWEMELKALEAALESHHKQHKG